MTEQANIYQEFNQLVGDIRQHLRWQQSQGWDGVPYDLRKGRYIVHAQSQNLEPRPSQPAPPKQQRQAPPTPPPPATAAEGLEQLRYAMTGERSAPPKPETDTPPARQTNVAAPTPETTSQPINLEISDPHGPPGWKKVSALPSISERELLDAESRLQEIRTELGNCQRCQLSQLRRNLVFGTGKARTRLMIIGASPEEEDDETGAMFSGPQSHLVEQMLLSMGVKKDEVYFTHIVKCYPPNKRHPLPGDVNTCSPFLWKQIDTVKPEVILTLGAAATQTVLKSNKPFGTLRNQWFQVNQMSVLATFHPAYLLRNPKEKVKAWGDLQMIVQRLTQ